MKKILTILCISALAFVATGCSKQIPPGYVGKIVSAQGVQPEIHGPGYTREWYRERLILLQTSSELKQAKVNVIMADPFIDSTGETASRIGLDMDFIVNIRYRLRSDDNVITSMLKDMKLDDKVTEISVGQIYNKYANMVVGRVYREVLGKYTPEQVLGHLEEINATLDAKIKEALNSSPLVVSSVSLGPISLPDVITARVRANKDTELSEAQKRAQQKIDLLDKQNEIELARQQAVRERIDAQSLAEQNKILNASITKEVLRLRELQIREKEIAMMEKSLTSGNNNTVFVPYGAIDNPGAQMRMFQK